MKCIRERAPPLAEIHDQRTDVLRSPERCYFLPSGDGASSFGVAGFSAGSAPGAGAAGPPPDPARFPAGGATSLGKTILGRVSQPTRATRNGKLSISLPQVRSNIGYHL